MCSARCPISDAARRETLRDLVANLTTHAPHWFSARRRHACTTHLTGETWDLAAPPCDPLELAGRLVQEDLCIIQQPAMMGHAFTAAAAVLSQPLAAA